ncbi:MAG: relaxase domain-containing protein [Defluviicoccus sp.]|nr:relaxase domain-containing protein [Defluviicoccus sp.]MDE0334483.1 relaxase domain-containing protein [Defluviicoccus sp.]
MVAKIARAATADYYIHSQASFRPPGEYYMSGEEPDGIWWNPSGLFNSEKVDVSHEHKIDSAAFYALYRGIDPKTGEKLTRNADSDKRCPAYDITFNADKSVSTLWAIAPPELREEIAKAHNDAVKVALEDIIKAHCSYTRIRTPEEGIKIVPADMIAALFQHGASRSNDPHLHTHCVILNLAKAHHDGKYRALHGHPLFAWQKAAGATYLAELAWLLRDRLGIEMETHGDENQYSRIKDSPEELIEEWSKRNIEITDTASRMGMKLKGNGALSLSIQQRTREAKQHGIDPETRHRHWTAEAGTHIPDIDAHVDHLTGRDLEFTEQHVERLTENLSAIPGKLTQYESTFNYTDLIEHTAYATEGLISREHRNRMVDQVLATEQIVELDKPDTKYDAGAALAHSRTFTAPHTIETEREIHELAGTLSRRGGYEIPANAVADKIAALKAEGYPLDQEQIDAIQAVTRDSPIAIIEGAAGSGKTTTLRPVADLYREQGYDIIATSVSWRVTLELGSDLDAPNHCVDALHAGMVSGKLTIGPKTVIVVDEAGQLSSLQAAQILRMARGAGAKVIFAGDTQQQQPVEAGPGLRLVKDVAGSVRVDTIRRQKADPEDILSALDGLAPAAARERAAAATPEETRAILDRFEALPKDDKARIRPWQIAASQHFRKGEAAQGIAAYKARGRIHIDRNLSATLERLVDDWHRFTQTDPDKSSTVIAYSRAEVKTLSHMMRARLLADYDGPRHTVQVCRSRQPSAKPEALELAVGDIIRTGAKNFERGILNGTYIQILELREDQPPIDGPSVPRIWIRGRTSQGAIVEFHHDEVTDYYGKIRLDYGYAMTMNAAQGITVDRAFVFANQKPSRETIYPAFTRHRERLDIYVDRQPVELDVRRRRSEDIAGDPVTDNEILDYLAGNWSRSKQKEAAQDYMTEHMRDRHIEPQSRERPAPREPRIQAPAAERQTPLERPPAHHAVDAEGLDAPKWLTANDAGDGKLAEIAAQIRYSEIRVKHGLAAKTLGQACRKLNASLAHWDRARHESGNAAVAMNPDFKRDLKEASAVLKTVKPFLQNDPLHAHLLREHGGIDISDLETLASAHTRAMSIRRMSAEDRRRLDADFAGAPPAKTAEHAAAAEIAAAFEAIEPEPRSQATDTMIEPPTDLWEGWDQYHAQAELDSHPDYGRDEEEWGAADWGVPDAADPVGHDYPQDPSIDEAPFSHDEPAYAAHRRKADPDTPAPETLGAEERFQRLRESWIQHRDAANEVGQHPFLAPGWTELHREFRDVAALPDLSEHRRADVERSVRIADAWLSRHAQQTVAADPAEAATGYAPTHELVNHHCNQLAEHIAAAENAGIHPFDLPGWDKLRQDLGDILTLPDITSADRSDIVGLLALIDLAPEQQPRHHATIDEQIQDHHARFASHVEAANAAGVHPLQAAGWDRLEQELRAFLYLPDLPAEHRTYVEAQISDIDNSRAALDAGAHQIEPQQPQSHDPTPHGLYRDHMQRHDTYMQ